MSTTAELIAHHENLARLNTEIAQSCLSIAERLERWKAPTDLSRDERRQAAEHRHLADINAAEAARYRRLSLSRIS